MKATAIEAGISNCLDNEARRLFDPFALLRACGFKSVAL
jgi:hypothetical protein